MSLVFRQRLCVVLLNAFLLSPLAVEKLWLGRASDLPLYLFLFSVATSVLWLALVHLVWRRVLFAHLALAPLYLVVGADLFAITHVGTRITSSVVSVVLESLGETGEFFSAHRGAIVVVLLPVVALYGIGLWNIRNASLPRSRPALLVVATLLCASYVPMYFACGDRVHLAAADRSTPFGIIPQAWLAFRVHDDMRADVARTRSFRFGATRTNAPAEPETYVLAIGESARPDHFGLYGYHRDTTPRLAAQPNLIVFRDVVSQASYTTLAVPWLLERSSAAHPDRGHDERSVIALYHELGFLTEWLSTQQREPFAGELNRCSADADKERYLERQRDSALVELVVETLVEAGDGHPKRLLVLHMMGSHYAYENRCPAEDRRFALGGSHALMDVYDDSIACTDSVLSSLIDVLRRARGIKALLYVGDHGENLEDDGRRLFGHYLSNEYDLPVPMLLWYSDELAARWPEKIAAARRAAALPLSTRTVFYTLTDLADAHIDDPDLATMSLVGSAFRPSPRIVKRGDVTFDYDEHLRLVHHRPTI
jgi:glucan phosphoethanolaminetransferase (alkaline phosphatase superfamily)